MCADLGCSFEWEDVGHFDPPAFDETLVGRVRSAAERLGYSHMDIISGAGHDACWINRVAPTAMVMCPCVDGLSHNEAEEISPEWARAGADVLFPRGRRDGGGRGIGGSAPVRAAARGLPRDI
ncbi:M20/M25/M40 family metallo-hydrolase [Jhaorihella thermophila]